MPFPFWSLIPAAAQMGATYLNKPRKKDFTMDTDYIDRYTASLRGRQSNREVEDLLMRPALRAIGAQAGRMNRQIEYDANRPGGAPVGATEQMRLSANQQLLQASTAAGEKAGLAQLQETRRLQEGIDRAELEKGEIKSRSDFYYNRAKRDWKNQMIGSAVNLGAETIGAVGQNITANRAPQLEDWNQALQTAKANRFVPEDMDVNDFVNQASQSGFNDNPNAMLTYLQTGNRKQTAAGDRVVNLYDQLQRNVDPYIIQKVYEKSKGQTGDLMADLQSGTIDVDQLYQQATAVQQEIDFAEAEQKKKLSENARNIITYANTTDANSQKLQQFVADNINNMTYSDINIAEEYTHRLAAYEDQRSRQDATAEKELAKTRKNQRTYTADRTSLHQRMNLIGQTYPDMTNEAKKSFDQIYNILENTPNYVSEKQVYDIKEHITRFVNGLNFANQTFDENTKDLAIFLFGSADPGNKKLSLQNNLFNYVDRMFKRDTDIVADELFQISNGE